MRLIVFNYGTTELTEDRIFLKGESAKTRTIALLFLLIETAGRRILVDTGCDTLPGFEMIRHCRPVDVLKTCGITPEEITDVIVTHGHQDHSGCLGYYPKARLYIHPEELKQLRLTGENTVIPVDAECEIIPGVRMKPIGGHTRGSSIVLVTIHEQTWVLCGDECYSSQNLKKQIPTGCSRSPERSLRFVQKYSKPSYIPVVFHDPEILDEIGWKILAEDDG